MKVRLDIPDKIYRALAKRARKDGIDINELIIRSVERMLMTKLAARRKAPVIDSDRPGSLYLDNAKIFEIIDFP